MAVLPLFGLGLGLLLGVNPVADATARVDAATTWRLLNDYRAGVERLAADFDHAFSELSLTFSGERGRVVIGALPSVAAGMLPLVVASFLRDHPQVEIILRDHLSGEPLTVYSELVVVYPGARCSLPVQVAPVPVSSILTAAQAQTVQPLARSTCQRRDRHYLDQNIVDLQADYRLMTPRAHLP